MVESARIQSDFSYKLRFSAQIAVYLCIGFVRKVKQADHKQTGIHLPEAAYK